ncbi:hypothetical protein HZH68_008147 [Vespula germanica]|uniref:G-protein coupled receptors family 1 profile domain-containing protein n=1 Tax=Vespula germanica TaxID=30212 RepID=A0A834N7B8_VESGE|nr:hypothetical protein HZH68_008147 [Vespula germanica]
MSEINSRWSLGPELCDIWTSSDVLCCTASILHLVAIAVDRYWAVTDLNYTQGRSPKKIGFLIAMVWIVSFGISMAPHFGWKDPDYLERIAEGECLVSQDPAYQKFNYKEYPKISGETGYAKGWTNALLRAHFLRQLESRGGFLLRFESFESTGEEFHQFESASLV